MLQTHEVLERIKLCNPECNCEIIEMESEGDLTEAPLHTIGGKGLFVSKLESALANGVADIAVHSLKDVPAALDSEFSIAATLPREDERDALLLKDGLNIDDLSKNLKIATSGPRRKSQLLAINPKLNVVPIRGNIQTRINKMDAENFDGLIVAKAALNRLEILHPNMHLFSEDQMLPAAAQGAIGIEVTSGVELISVSTALINDQSTYEAKKLKEKLLLLWKVIVYRPSLLYGTNNKEVELKEESLIKMELKFTMKL